MNGLNTLGVFSHEEPESANECRRRGNMPRFIHVHPPVHEHLGEGLTLRHICLAQWTDTTGALQGFGADADPPRALLVPPPPPGAVL